MKHKWERKFHQMMRSYDKLKKVSTNTGSKISNVDGKEAVEEFFTQCYHLKDWIIGDFPDFKEQIESNISKSKPLSLAADFCNTCKHGELKRTRLGEKIKAILEHTKIDITPKGFVCSAQVEIRTESKSHNAFKIATNCIRDWNKILKDINLSIPTQ